MATIELPAITLDRESFETVRQGALVVLSLLSFWLMAAAKTSHHTEFHYSFYPSLTFFVWVGVVSFLYSGGLAAGRAVRAIPEELRQPLESYGPLVMLWLILASAGDRAAATRSPSSPAPAPPSSATGFAVDASPSSPTSAATSICFGFGQSRSISRPRSSAISQSLASGLSSSSIVRRRCALHSCLNTRRILCSRVSRQSADTELLDKVGLEQNQ